MALRRWFGPLALALVVGLIGLTEGVLRYAGVAAPRRLFERVRTLDDRDVYRSVPGRFEAERVMGRPLPERTFSGHKAPGSVRIFVVGESTAFGYPFGPEGSYARFLELRLASVAPEGRSVEVVNAAAPGVGAEDVLEVVREVLAYEADLVIVGVGQNEFINHPWSGRSVWLDDVQIWLRRTALFGAARRVFGAGVPPSGDDLRSFLNALSPLDAATPLDPGDSRRQHGLDFFRSRLARMVQSARDRRVPLVLMTQASNLRDWKPFSGEAATRAYSEAKSLDQAGRYPEALAAYERARDLDGLPVRAPGAFNDAIRAMAGDGVAVVDLASQVEAWARDGIPGSDLFLDDLHPRLPVHDRIAGLLHRALADERVLDWPGPAAEESPSRVDAVLGGAALAAAFNDQAAYCARLGEHGLAVEHFRAAERLAEAAGPDARQTLLDARLGLAVVLQRMGDADGSRAALASARPLDPALVDAVAQQIEAESRATAR